MRTLYLIGFILLSQFTSGCTSLDSAMAQQNQKNSLSNLVLPEPARVDYRAQRAIVQFNQIMANPDLDEADRAQLLFQRGLVYDSMGLDGLAIFDFSQAVRLKPDMPDAYNSLGIHYTIQGEFLEAYEAFDSTLEIDPEYDFAFFNRGLAAYYSGRFELAKSDLSEYYNRDTNDPLRALWLYFSHYKINPDLAFSELKTAREMMTSNPWAAFIIDFYLGDITQKVLLDRVLVGVENRTQLNERLCELYFYLGKFYTIQGQSSIANNFFKLALSTNIFEFVEHRYARLELDNLRRLNAEKYD